jgi:hypothetical protein
VLRAHSNKPPVEQGHRSPGFSLISDYLRAEQKHNVLDLGPALSANIEFFSSLQCKVYVEHLSTLLRKLNTAPADEEGTDPSEALGELLSFAGDTRFDVVLAWDLFNYLEPPALDALIARLVRFCNRGTLLFALVCIGKHMPDAPMGITIAAQDRLFYEVASTNTRRCPQYSSPVLLKKLQGFSVVRSYLLQNNIQEYVLRYQ